MSCVSLFVQCIISDSLIFLDKGVVINLSG